jgi:hypothetical protein
VSIAGEGVNPEHLKVTVERQDDTTISGVLEVSPETPALLGPYYFLMVGSIRLPIQVLPRSSSGSDDGSIDERGVGDNWG